MRDEHAEPTCGVVASSFTPIPRSFSLSSLLPSSTSLFLFSAFWAQDMAKLLSTRYLLAARFSLLHNQRPRHA